MTSFDFDTMEFEDFLDVRDIIARIEELESELDLETDLNGESDEEQELSALKSIMDEMKGYGGDEQWRGYWYPVTLIRDSYFEEYTEELVTDCGYISKDFPVWIAIDWEATARTVQMDYSTVEIKGVTYWYR